MITGLKSINNNNFYYESLQNELKEFNKKFVICGITSSNRKSYSDDSFEVFIVDSLKELYEKIHYFKEFRVYNIGEEYKNMELILADINKEKFKIKEEEEYKLYQELKQKFENK